MTTWTFPAGGGDDWDDLWDARPWYDPAHDADREQDDADRRERLVAVIRERWRSCDLMTAAVDVALEAGPPPAPAPFCQQPRTAYDNSELTTARRRRHLAEALEPPTTRRTVAGAA